MRRTFGAAAVAAALLLGPTSVATAVPVSQAFEGAQTQNTQDDGDNGLWGLAGLLGLAGLAGLRRREHTTQPVRIDRAA